MLSAGTLLSGRYRVESILGQGGMGAVYLAHQEALGNKRVAVKEMELKGYSDQEMVQAVEQFNKEASFLANLDHPNLVQVTDFFIENNKHYLVMAYVTGQTLQQKLKAYGRPFSWDMLKPYADSLVEVLSYLHNQSPPILFRDLKPSNIMIEDSGRLRLIDFGIARTAQAGDRTSTFLQGTGTSGFSPIEQYGGGQSTDQRSDIYALGATLYYLLTGKIPPDAVARISQGKKLIPATQLNPTLPKELDNLFSKSMALRQHERHASMADFQAELATIQGPAIDTEGATEDFGELPPVGGTTNQIPPSEQGSAPQGIVVEMFPTSPAIAPTEKQSMTPWAIGFASMAVAGLMILGMVAKGFPGSKEPGAKTEGVKPEQTISSSVSESKAKEKKPFLVVPPPEKKPEEVKAASTIRTKRPRPRPVVSNNRPKPQPKPVVRTQPKPKPKPKVRKKPKATIGGGSYPTAAKKYPTAKPRPKPQPKQVEVSAPPVSTAQQPVQQPVQQAPPQQVHYPPPPPGAPPLLRDEHGRPLPPHMQRGPRGPGPGGRGPGERKSGIPGY